MNWRALYDENCPSCGDKLSLDDSRWQCSSCDFSISEDRMTELVDDLETDDAYRPYGPHDRIT